MSSSCAYDDATVTKLTYSISSIKKKTKCCFNILVTL